MVRKVRGGEALKREKQVNEKFDLSFIFTLLFEHRL